MNRMISDRIELSETFKENFHTLPEVFKVKRFFSVVFLLVLCCYSLFAGDVRQRRKMQIAKTQYFDIIYSDESLYTANLLIENADKMYEQVFETFSVKKKFRIPVVISPDSEKLLIKYAPTPYNRIVIFEAVPDLQNSNFENTVLSLFYHEVAKALSQSVISPFVQVVKKVFDVDALQPIPLLSLPFSFAEGVSFIEESKGGDGRLNDGYFLQILSQAKYEKKFPSWTKLSVKKTNPYENEIAYAAGAAFFAFIQQRWGMEKFAEYWNQNSKIHLVLFTMGNFKKIYKTSLSQAWKDFEESIPLPEKVNLIEENEKNTKSVLTAEANSVSNLISSPYGLVYYDDIHKQVNMISVDEKQKTSKRKLFYASDVTDLTVSPDGRFLVLSYYNYLNREQFKKSIARIYDLKEKSFLDGKYELANASVIKLSNGFYGLAGFNVNKKNPVLEIYEIEELNELILDKNSKTELIFTRSFDFNTIFSSPVSVADGKIALIVNKNNKWSVVEISFGGKEDNFYKEELYCINELALKKFDKNSTEKSSEKTDKNMLKITNLRAFYNQANSESEKKLAFNYVIPEVNSFTRMGYITLNDSGDFEKVYLQENDFSGGFNGPCFYSNQVYFYSKRINETQINSVAEENIVFINGTAEKRDENLLVLKEKLPESADAEVDAEIDSESENKAENKAEDKTEDKTKDKTESEVNSEIKIVKYSPINYWFHGVFIPMIGVRELDLDEEAKFWPGLGVTYMTNSDPLLNTDMIFSGAAGFAKLDFDFLNNPTNENFNKMLTGINDFDREWAFSVFVKNTSTPVDLSIGSMFRFDPFEGKYEGSAIGMTSWQIPLDMSFRKIALNIQGRYLVSTDYYDLNQIETKPSFKDWPSPFDAYSSLLLKVNANYSDIRQSGITPFEMKGLAVTLSLNAFWDLNHTFEQIKLMEEETEQDNQTENESLFGGNNTAIGTFLSLVDQFNIGLKAQFAIPKIIPVPVKNGLVLSLPSVVQADLFNEVGNFLKVDAKTLLIGWESNLGISPIVLYLRRMGLSLAYTASLEYDTKKVSLPSFLQLETFEQAVTQCFYNDVLTLSLNMDFSPMVGKFTETEIKTQFDFMFLLKKQTFNFRFTIDFLYL